MLGKGLEQREETAFDVEPCVNAQLLLEWLERLEVRLVNLEI